MPVDTFGTPVFKYGGFLCYLLPYSFDVHATCYTVQILLFIYPANITSAMSVMNESNVVMSAILLILYCHGGVL